MKEFHYRWEWQLNSSPEQIWPFVAETNRFNHDAGVPPIEMLGATAGKRRLRLYVMGVPVEWDEPPYEWVKPHKFSIVRRYCSGPVEELRVQAEFLARPEGGTTLIYQVWARPRNFLGHIVIPFQLGVVSAKAFERAVRVYDDLAQHSKVHAHLAASNGSLSAELLEATKGFDQERFELYRVRFARPG